MIKSAFYYVLHTVGFVSVLVFDFSDLHEVLAALGVLVLVAHRVYLFLRDIQKAREEDLKKSQEKKQS